MRPLQVLSLHQLSAAGGSVWPLALSLPSLHCTYHVTIVAFTKHVDTSKNLSINSNAVCMYL